jgi:NAD(P)H-nitrite reductase large subunit
MFGRDSFVPEKAVFELKSKDKKVVLYDGTEMPYEKVCICTGAFP